MANTYIKAAFCIVMSRSDAFNLDALIEMERLASLGSIDGSLQVDLKRQFLRPAV